MYNPNSIYPNPCYEERGSEHTINFIKKKQRAAVAVAAVAAAAAAIGASSTIRTIIIISLDQEPTYIQEYRTQFTND